MTFRLRVILPVYTVGTLVAFSSTICRAQPALTADQAMGAQVLGQSGEWAAGIYGGMSGIIQTFGPGSVGGQSRPGEPPVTKTEELPAENGLPAGSRTTTTSTIAQRAGPKLIVKMTIRISEKRGKTVVNGAAKADIEVDACPDSNGIVNLKMDISTSGDTGVANSAGTGGTSLNSKETISASGQVGDDAMLKSVSVAVSSRITGRSGIRPAIGPNAGRSSTANVERTVSVRFTTQDGGEGNRVTGYQSEIGGDTGLTDAQQQSLAATIGALAEVNARKAFEGAVRQTKKVSERPLPRQ